MKSTKNKYWAMVIVLAVFAGMSVGGCKCGECGKAAVRKATTKGSAEPEKTPAQIAAEEQAAKEAAEKAAREKVALAPIILGEIMPEFAANDRNKAALAAVAKGEKPKRQNQFLRDIVYTLTTYYRQAGVYDYDWHDFGPAMKDAEWYYYSFDPKEERDKSKGGRYRKVTYPDGMENWFAKDFDPKAAGWKLGKAPFGQLNGKKVATGRCGPDGECRCGVTPGTLWEKEVILIHQTFKVPELKKGYRYRIVIGGSNHVNAGEGFDLYVDGKKIASSGSGVGKRQGGQPRGGHIYKEFLPDFKDGEITVAVRSFLRYNHPRINPYPPRGHLSVWLEEQKLPPEVLSAASE